MSLRECMLVETPQLGTLVLYKNELISHNIVSEGVWEQDILNVYDHFIKPDMNVIDCGAFVGEHDIFISKRCYLGKVYAFEPHIHNFILLCQNVILNEKTKCIIPINLSLGAKTGINSFGWSLPNNMGSSGISDNNPISEQSDVQNYIQHRKYTQSTFMTTLDSFNFEKVDFIKIDTEGYELNIIKGGLNIIKQSRPIILFEYTHGKSTDEVFDIMKRLNYALFKMGPKNYDVGNYICVPIDKIIDQNELTKIHKLADQLAKENELKYFNEDNKKVQYDEFFNL